MKLSILFAFITTLTCFADTQSTKPESISLFNGSTLEGWEPIIESHSKFWSVKDGMIHGFNVDESGKSHSTYLVHKTPYENFELTFDFRLSGDPASGVINGGMHYRTTREGFKMAGYQADMGVNWWGGIYEEHGRKKLVTGNEKALVSSEGFKHDGWHHYKIFCQGNVHKLYINGILMSEYVEEDEDVPSKGVFGVQLHGAGDARIEMKNVILKKL